jgi:hypothetical protein
VSKKKSAARVYVVERLALEAWTYEGLRYSSDNRTEENASYQPVRAFASQKAAEAYRATLDAELRERFPPALFCENDEDELACDPKALADLLAGFGLTPPAFRGESYSFPKKFRKWWAANGAALMADQVAQVWALFPDVSVHRVHKTTLEG